MTQALPSVLVVEDEPAVRAVATLMIAAEMSGYLPPGM